MGMTHSTSGKMGYNYHYRESDYKFNRETLIKVLKYEDNLRLHDPDIQKKYTECGDDSEKFSDVTHDLQKKALLDCGIGPENLSEALLALRNMRIDYENDDEILELAVYHRVDKCFDSNLCNGYILDSCCDSVLMGLDGKPTTLFSYYKQVDPNRTKPFVIFSGSVTWPPFRKEVATINDIAEKFKEVAVFLVVYVSEAHAIDESPLGSSVCIPKHKNIEDRIEVAKKYLVEERKCKIPVLVDTMNNDFEEVYKGWPERFYIIQGDVLKVIAQPSGEDLGFDRSEVSNWLECLTSKKNDQNLDSVENN